MSCGLHRDARYWAVARSELVEPAVIGERRFARLFEEYAVIILEDHHGEATVAGGELNKKLPWRQLDKFTVTRANSKMAHWASNLWDA